MNVVLTVAPRSILGTHWPAAATASWQALRKIAFLNLNWANSYLIAQLT